jgi:hypothetical protein
VFEVSYEYRRPKLGDVGVFRRKVVPCHARGFAEKYDLDWDGHTSI